MQATSNLLMIRPENFIYNAETAVNNTFQVQSAAINVQEQAVHEFDNFVTLLRKNNIDVLVVQDTPVPHTPDSIFPNNWISFHADGSIILYPMFAANRRAERKAHVLESIQNNFSVNTTIDFTSFEKENKFLEGTGSMVLDRENKIAYACISPRTDETLLKKFSEKTGYSIISFEAIDEKKAAIYHTNVMMCVADKYVVICLSSIHKPDDAEAVIAAITKTGKEIIPISFEQMNHFAGNMLQVKDKDGQSILILSTQAYQALTQEQIQQLSRYNPLLHSSLETIETNGGGSARCMMAEVFLPNK